MTDGRWQNGAAVEFIFGVLSFWNPREKVQNNAIEHGRTRGAPDQPAFYVSGPLPPMQSTVRRWELSQGWWPGGSHRGRCAGNGPLLTLMGSTENPKLYERRRTEGEGRRVIPGGWS
jgi:hypothetical protein